MNVENFLLDISPQVWYNNYSKKRMEIDIMDFMTELGKKIDELGAELDELSTEIEKLKKDTAKMHKEIDTLNNKTKAENEKLKQFLNEI